MLNQSILVGRVCADVKLEKDDDKTFINLTIAVPRSYKNEDGEYETDFIDCVLYGCLAENVAEYCKKGDLVGIKGRMQTEMFEDGRKSTIIIADKVTFLSSSKGDEKDGE